MQGQIHEMAALLQGMGRGGDTILAHINPQEAMLLNAVTDGGSINPVTGMPEFFIDDMTGWDEPGMFTDVPDSEDISGSPPEGYDPYAGEPNMDLGNLLLTAVTAPLEAAGNVLGFDPEFTGQDLIGPDWSRSFAGIDTPQPIGVEFNPGAAVGGLFAPGIGELVGGLASPTYGYDATTGQTFSYSANPVASAVGGAVSDLVDLGFNYGDSKPESASTQAADASVEIATTPPNMSVSNAPTPGIFDENVSSALVPVEDTMPGFIQDSDTGAIMHYSGQPSSYSFGWNDRDTIADPYGLVEPWAKWKFDPPDVEIRRESNPMQRPPLDLIPINDRSKNRSSIDLGNYKPQEITQALQDGFYSDLVGQNLNRMPINPLPQKYQDYYSAVIDRTPL